MVVAIRIGIRQRGTAHVGGAAGMRKAGARKRGKMLDLPQGAATGDVAEYEHYQILLSRVKLLLTYTALLHLPRLRFFLKTAAILKSTSCIIHLNRL